MTLAIPQLAHFTADTRANRARYATILILYGGLPEASQTAHMEQRAFNDPNPVVRQAATNVHALLTRIINEGKR
jgi:hypothetical protein